MTINLNEWRFGRIAAVPAAVTAAVAGKRDAAERVGGAAALCRDRQNRKFRPARTVWARKSPAEPAMLSPRPRST